MNIGKLLREERERFQVDLGEDRASFDEIARDLFGHFERPAEKLKRIEAGEEIPTREEARRLLRHYGVTGDAETSALKSYRVDRLLKSLADGTRIKRRALAADAGLSYHHFMRLLSGSRMVRDQAQLMKLADVFGAEPEDRLQLLQQARIEDRDPLILDLLARTASSTRSEQILRVDALRRDIGTRIGESPWPSAGKLDYDTDASSSARGPIEITTLASRLVRQAPSTGSKTNGAAAGGRMVRISLGRRFVGDPHMLAGFLGAVRDALDDGVDVRCVLPWAKEPNRVFGTIGKSLSFLGTRGRYDLRYAHPEDQRDDPLRSIIAPNGKALVFLPRETSYEDNVATVVGDEDGAIRDHFDRRFAESRPVLTLYRSEASDPSALQAALREAERQSGPRFLIKRRFTGTAIPGAHWGWEQAQILRACDPGHAYDDACGPWRFERMAIQDARRRGGKTTADVLDLLRREKVLRVERHLQTLHEYPTREIYSRERIERFLGDPDLPHDLRVAILDQFLDWIERYDHYSLALVDDDELFEDSLFGLHGGDSVFLSVGRSAKRADYLRINQTVVAGAFATYFLDRWKRLPEESRSRQAISEQLRALKSTAGRNLSPVRSSVLEAVP